MKICLQCTKPIITVSWQCNACGWKPLFDGDFALFAPEIAGGGTDYPADAHDRLAQIEAGNFWFITRNRLLTHLLDRFFPDAQNMLEIGCGTGFVMAGLAQSRPDIVFFGAEAYPSGLKYAQSRLPLATFAQMDACKLPFIEEFDVIGAFDVIEHIDDDRKALAEMYKVSKPGGGIMITVPQHRWLWSRRDEKAGHKRRYTRKELWQKVEDAGFKTVLISSFITILLPFMIGTRLLANTPKSNPAKKPPPDMRLPARINDFFIKICNVERALIKARFSLPAGGSLVCLAQKK